MACTDYLSPGSSRNATTEDDSADHIESDTPKSGIATPVPDPSDKRFPGITHTDNYFNQVGSGSSISSNLDGALETPEIATKGLTPLPSHTRELFVGDAEQTETPSASQQEISIASGDTGQEASHLGQEQANASTVPQLWSLHPYPTPPTSGPPSLHKLKISEPKEESDGEVDAKRVPPLATAPDAHRKSISDSSSRGRRASMLTPLSSIVTASNVHAAHFSNPSDRPSTTTPTTPSRSRFASNVSSNSASYERLSGLTDGAEKSQPGTPTRALSNQASISNDGASNTSAPALDRATSQNSNGSGVSPLKGIRGKLTIKIVEARGLRRCKDPYVVAIFQRNELVSRGPKAEDDDDEDDDIPMRNHMGGIPISRQGSESGRTMAIPMKSRQSSSASLTEYRDFRKKPRGGSFTAPRWGTEAIL